LTASVAQGHFPQLTHRESLWRLLVVITAHKAGRLRRDEGRQKRGGAATVVADAMEADAENRLLAELFSREPTLTWPPRWPMNTSAC
jgi:hypothetical protein